MYRWQRRDRLISTNLSFADWKNQWKDSMREEVKQIFEEVRGAAITKGKN